MCPCGFFGIASTFICWHLIVFSFLGKSFLVIFKKLLKIKYGNVLFLIVIGRERESTSLTVSTDKAFKDLIAVVNDYFAFSLLIFSLLNAQL